MPELKLSSAGQLDKSEEIVNYLEKLRKEVTWLFGNLDTSNIVELNAKVINSGSINADKVSIQSADGTITIGPSGIVATFIGGATLTINKNGLVASYLDGTTIKINSDGMTVDRGHYFITDKTTVMPEIVGQGQNMIRDHSFEAVIRKGAADGEGTFAIEDTLMGNYYWWMLVGNPRIRSTLQTDAPPVSLFGHQSILVNDSNYVWTWAAVRKESLRGPYNLSVHAAPRGNNTPGASVSCTVTLKALNSGGGALGSVAGSFNLTPSYSAGDIAQYKRGGITYETLPIGTAYLQAEIKGNNAQWIEADGVSLVPFAHPIVYSAEDSLWSHVNNLDGAFHKNLTTMGSALFVTPDGESYLTISPYDSENQRALMLHERGFDIRNPMAGASAPSFSVNTVNKRVFTPWLVLDGGVDLSNPQNGCVAYRNNHIRFYDSGEWKDLVTAYDLWTAISNAIDAHVAALH